MQACSPPNGYNHWLAGAPVLPDRCSLRERGRQCPRPPEFVVSITTRDGEYMVGVACGRHANAMAAKIRAVQGSRAAPRGEVRLTSVRPVGTDCIRAACDDISC